MRTSSRFAAVAGVGLAALSIAPAPASAASVGIFSSDFEAGAPAALSGGTLAATGGYSAFGFGSQYYQSAASITLTLTALPAHTSVSLGFLFAAIDSWDGNAASHNCCAPDFFTVSVSGNTVFNNTFNNVWGFVPGFTGPDTQGYARGANELKAPTSNLVGEFWHDSAYNLGADPAFANIPHTDSTLTITFSSTALQGLSDESFALDNLNVVLNGVCLRGGCDVPEPETLALMLPVLLGLAAYRRRRPA